MKRHLKILYIHGYGSGANSITGSEIQRKLGDNATVFLPGFSNDLFLFENMKQNIRSAVNFIKEHNVDLVIGSSMGGFTAMQIPEVQKILIKPAMVPSEIFGHGILDEITEEDLEKYRQLENREVSPDEKKLTYALFSTDDELFSYKERFEKLYDSAKSFSMTGKHVISPRSIRENLLPLISIL
ncbi:MAG: hypothetical protein GX102_05890 [Porphyromonadaceae bacterium]|nr:hypothetical protein [Porphyromonadaceae bacterium]